MQRRHFGGHRPLSCGYFTDSWGSEAGSASCLTEVGSASSSPTAITQLCDGYYPSHAHTTPLPPQDAGPSPQFTLDSPGNIPTHPAAVITSHSSHPGRKRCRRPDGRRRMLILTLDQPPFTTSTAPAMNAPEPHRPGPNPSAQPSGQPGWRRSQFRDLPAACLVAIPAATIGAAPTPPGNTLVSATAQTSLVTRATFVRLGSKFNASFPASGSPSYGCLAVQTAVRSRDSPTKYRLQRQH